MADGDGPPSGSDREELPRAGVTDAGDHRRGERLEGFNSGVRPGALWGRFRIRRLVGEGGMGQVYEADDPSLGRRVALKLLRRDDPELLQRFLLEAKAQAQVDHENICKVYEAGEIQGRPYIAMQFIEGEPLDKVGERMSLAERIELMREVATAIDAAHRIGLIHRDIKPSNILVERQTIGGKVHWRPGVVDFGLAREVGARGETQIGSALGTPEYMAPEQAFGDSALLDRRVDVYGLGATMYELFSGRRPYEGEKSAEILARLLDSDPRRLRQIAPQVPSELETIVMKCLERDPQRRYADAWSVAQDLGRLLAGEPIEARPATLRYRLTKKLHKNLTWAVTAAVLGLLILGLAVSQWRSAWQARARAQLAHRFGMEAKEIESIMRYANLLPLHDTRRERALVRQRMDAIVRETPELGALGAGAADYALGLGHLALQEFRAAAERLQRAWDGGYQLPEVAYARGRALGEIYRSELRALGRIDGERPREVRRAEIEARYREPALQFLRQGKALQTEAPELVEGEIAFYEQRPEAALALARAAYQRVPWLYEARKLEGDIEELLAIDRQDRGDWSAAREHHERAGQAYAAALAAARSDAAVYGAECVRRRSVLELDLEQGKYSPAGFAAALAVCGDAVAANPDDAGAHIQAAETYWRLSEQQLAHGEDAADAVSHAVALAQEAARLDPRSADAYHRLGVAHELAAELADARGLDPVPALLLAETALRRAIELDASLPWPYNALGYTYNWQAAWQLRHGADARVSLDDAVQVLEEGARRDPTFWKVERNLALAHVLAAQQLLAVNSNPAAELDAGELAAERALRINPQGASALAERAAVWRLRAQQARSEGRDAGVALATARAACDEALRINPNAGDVLRESAAIDIALAADLGARHQDPLPALDRAAAAAQRAAETNPRDAAARIAGGRVEIERARWSRSEAPARLTRAERLLEEARALAPNDAEPLLGLAEVELRRAQASSGARADLAARLVRATRWCDRALGLNPALVEAREVRGELAALADKSRPPV